MEGKCFKLNKHLWQKVGRCHYYFTIEKKWCSTVILSQDKCRLILSELAPYIIHSEYIVFFKHSIIGSQCFITYRHQTVSLNKYCSLSYDILLPPQGFDPRGPKPEESYIEVPAPNMILLIDVYTRQNFSLSVFARKASLNTRCKYRERFFHVTGKFTV